MPREIAITFGKFNPPTLAHHDLVQGLINHAEKLGISHRVYTSKKYLKKLKTPRPHAETPLSPEQKRKHLSRAFKTDNIHFEDNPYKVIEDLIAAGHSKIHVVLGSDRVEDTGPGLKERYGDKVNIVSFGKKREKGAKGIAGISSTVMREHARSNNFEKFKTVVPPHMREEHVREMFDDIRGGLRAANEKLDEEVSAITRMKLARAARRTASRRKVVRRSRAKRRRSMKQLKVRATNEIVADLRSRISGRRNWKKIPYTQRVQIDRNLAKRRKLVTTMVKRIMPEVLKGESQRLKNLNNSFNPIVDEFFSNYITEASRKSRTSKESNRQPVDSSEKAKRKRQNTTNQRNSRSNHKQAVRSGDIKGRVYVVKNKRGEIEIVDKKSLRGDHEIIVDAKNANKSAVRSYLNEPSFVNTKTSIELFGKIAKDAGSSKTKGEEPSKSSSKKPKEKKEKAEKSKMPEMPPQMIPAVKKASKKDTFATSHDATTMETGIAFAVNAALGLSPEQMVEKGLIDKKDVDAVMANQHESFMPSCQRAAQQIIKQFGGLYLKHTGRLKQQTKLSDSAKDNGVVDNTPKSDLLLVDKKGNVIAGLSQKIGESQLSSGGPAETVTNLKWAMATVGDKLQPNTKKEIEKFIKFFETELSGNPRTKQGPVSLYQTGSEREGEDKEVKRREQLHDKATNMLNTVLNGDKKLATAFIYSLITGAGKFKEGDPAIATHILSANRDGTDLKMTQVDMNYASKLLDKVKFQMKFKSSAVETTDIRKKWNEFKERKKKLGQKISISEDFRPYSFRSVIRAYLTEDMFCRVSNLMKILFENKESSDLKKVIPQDPQTPEEAVQYLKDAFEYIGDDFFKFYQFFEDTTDADTTQPLVDWTNLATPNTVSVNKVMVNGKNFEIPVEEPYNYTPDGSIEYKMNEDRDYKSEYRNYHSKPEQRANRSKRVLARRLMMKLGRVKKGDGKDVDHKDGNPQNNGKHNLRVRNKSENRADND